MRFILPALLALAAAGCANVVTHPELKEFKDDVDKAHMSLSTKINANLNVYSDLVNKYDDLNKRVVEMNTLVTALASRAEDLVDQVKLLTARVQTLGQAPAAAGGAGEPLPRGIEVPKKLDEILREVETTLTHLRNGKLPQDQAAILLKPFARDAAPRMIQEIRTHLVNTDYAKQLEGILSGFPPDCLRVSLGSVLLERGLRDSAARVVGSTKDRDLGKILEEYVATPDEGFRLLLGDALVQCRNAKGIPLLVQSLKSPQLDTRTIAISSLKRLNQGDARGYRSALGPEPNADAIKAWEEWADKFGGVIFEP